MSEAPLLDLTVLDDLIEHIGPDSLRPVIELFIDESRRLAAAIAASADTAAGRDAARRAAHSLKSSAGQLGAAFLASLTAEIEHAAEHGGPLGAHVAGLDRCVAATAAALSERLSV